MISPRGTTTPSLCPIREFADQRVERINKRLEVVRLPDIACNVAQAMKGVASFDEPDISF